MKSEYLTTLFVVHNCHDVVERYAVALVADATHRHKRTCHRSNLEDRLNIPADVAVGEVQLALAEIGDSPTVSHQEILATSAAR